MKHMRTYVEAGSWQILHVPAHTSL